MAGLFSTSKKSADFRWVSRSAALVSTDAQLHRGLDGRGLEGLRDVDDGGKVLELAADLAHHEVASAEANLAVGSIDVPGARLEV